MKHNGHRTQSERAEQIAVFDWASKARNLFPALDFLFAIPNSGGYVGGYGKNMLRVMGMIKQGTKPGVPDIFLAYPKDGFSGLFIEMKSSRGRVSEDQHRWLTELQRVGYEVKIAFSAEEAIGALTRYLQ